MSIISTKNDLLKFVSSTGERFPVEELTKETKLNKDVKYVCGEYVYSYIGQCSFRQLKDKPGLIGIINNKVMVNGYDNASDEVRKENHISNIYNVKELDDVNVDSILNSYFNNYRMNNNLVISNKQKVVNTGDIYTPDLNEDDDALTRIMKLMLGYLKINRSAYKDNFDKDYYFDNMISSLNGATVNMSITRFLAWAELLDLYWEFELCDNGTDPDHEVGNILIASDKPLTIEYGEDTPGVYKVPLSDDDDPLKRLIKVLVIKKKMVVANYKDKGSTPHLINNMRSALKRKGRMMFPYFIYWCEILGMNYRLVLRKDEYEVTTDDCFNVDLNINLIRLEQEEDDEE